MKNQINMDGFIQICIVVEDIDKAAKAWADMFGAPVPEVRTVQYTHESNQTYRGQPVHYTLKVANVQGPGFVIELHEPDENPSTFREYLNKHGNGVHHVGFEAGQRRDAIVEELEACGFPVRTVGISSPVRSWTIMDTEDTLGVNLNIKPLR